MDIREAVVGYKPLQVWEKGFRSDVDAKSTGTITGPSAGVFLAAIKRSKMQKTKKFQNILRDDSRYQESASTFQNISNNYG